MIRLIVFLLVAMAILFVTGCGGGVPAKQNYFIVNTDYISLGVKRPVLGLIRIDNGEYVTETHRNLVAGNNLRVKLPLPQYSDYEYIVVVYSDKNNNGVYDYSDYEDIGVWDGYLSNSYGVWAGYYSSGEYMFADVRYETLAIYTDVNSVNFKKQTLTPREMITKFSQKTKK